MKLWENVYNNINPVDTYTQHGYNLIMIKSFADKETEKVYNQIFSKKLPRVEDLRVPPANHLEQLQGDRNGQYSIRINDQYRICFLVIGQCDFCDVEIVDYH